MPRLLACAALLAALAAAAPDARAAELKRFALAIGVNAGGPNRVRLRYAASDAASFAAVLSELGGIARRDILILSEPRLRDVDAGLAEMGRRVAEARATGARVELIVYYSGHSDEDGLLIAGEKLTYERLREGVRRIPADVHIAILDSCASGAFTRVKGGSRRPAFLVDEAHRVSGHAFLTSSSADEQAQESDRLGGSFFTHFLVGGLRGAADHNRDGRVTLSEAYQFAFNETLSQTQKTKYGAQHPAYDMHLVGTGDVILTDLNATSAALVLDKALAGRVFVRDAGGRLVLELGKVAGESIVLGLGPGVYQLILDEAGRRHAATVTLARGARVAVLRAQFSPVTPELTVARGGEPYDGSPVNLDLFHLPSYGDRDRHVFSFNLLVGGGARLDGVEIGGLANVRTESTAGLQIAGVGNIDAGEARAVLVAGVFNTVSGGMDGVQIAGAANVGGAGVRGVQVAGVTNLVAGEAGYQIAGVGNWAGRGARGAQIAGVANVNGAGTRALQVAGVANLVDGEAHGLQIAGVANVTSGAAKGVQIAGVANVTNGEARGAQIGVVNVARRAAGLQLGVINVATESSAGAVPIGLLSVAPDGHRSADVWLADIVPLRVGVKLGSGRVYNLFAVGTSEDLVAGGLGIGVHLLGPGYYLDVDVASYMLGDHHFEATDVDQLAELRAMVGIPLEMGLSVFAGVSGNALFSYGDRPVMPLSRAYLPDKQVARDDVLVRFSPGFVVGLSY